MTSRLSSPRRCLLALVGGATLLGASACGGSSSSTQVSSAVKSRVESTLEQSAQLSAAQAKQVTDCLAPTLKAHGITTLADAKNYGPAPWAASATKTCMKQAGLGG